MHDIVDLEGRGVVGVFVASSVFVDAAAAQAVSLGLTPASLFVAHPIQDRTDAEMEALADEAVHALLRKLTNDHDSSVD